MTTVNYISMGLDLFCIGICLLIYISLVLGSDKSSRMKRMFCGIVLSNIGVALFDFAAWLGRGRPERWAFYTVRAANFLHYIFGYLVLLTVTAYLLTYISLKVKFKSKFVYTVIFLCGAGILLTVVSQFNGMYYIINENNEYQRQGMYWLSQVIPLSGMLINAGIIIYYRKIMRKIAALFFLMYMFMPIITMIIQFLFYGITLINIGITLTVLLLYAGVQIEYAKDLEAAIAATARQLELQESHYKTLREHINQTKAAKHDLRHHLSLIQAYIDTEDSEKLKQYVSEYAKSLPIDTEIIFCENYAVNMLLWHYASLAGAEGIKFDAQLDVPENMGVSDSDLCIVFGNLIENAIDAARETTGERFINMRSKITGNMFCLGVDNGFSGEIREENGIFISSKHEGEGIGIPSIKALAGKYDGKAIFEAGNNMFRASVILRNSKV